MISIKNMNKNKQNKPLIFAVQIVNTIQMTNYLISLSGILLALYSIALAVDTSNLISAEFFKATALLIGLGILGFLQKSGVTNQR